MSPSRARLYFLQFASNVSETDLFLYSFRPLEKGLYIFTLCYCFFFTTFLISELAEPPPRIKTGLYVTDLSPPLK